MTADPNPRRSGILLHPTSLPGPGGIGDLGPGAQAFLDRLKECGQSLWQVLPLGPTGYGDSPYQSLSAFAGNPLLVSPAVLADEGLVAAGEARDLPGSRPDRVDFEAVIPEKWRLIRLAHDAVRAGQGPSALRREWEEFRERHEEGWLREYALFAAIHDEQSAPWVDWPEPLARRDPAGLAKARSRLGDGVELHTFAQFLFFRQWEALRARAGELGISLFGDVPIFVAHDSADVWANPELFDLDAAGHPNRLSGAPPDVFTDDGQLWGNPLYRWDVLEERGFDWWIERVRATLAQFDLVRLDHFRGFVGCWTVPAGETTARNGRWDPVPGRRLFEALEGALGALPFVAEDLGDITPEVNALRDDFGFPGMKILMFGFGGDPKENEFAPHRHVPHCVVYTGTHDNETVRGWFERGIFEAMDRPREEAEEERANVLAVVGGDGSEIHWDFVRTALASVADTVVVPVQDVLGLGNEARMNFPGTLGENWTWRLPDDLWTPEVTARLARLVRATGRWPE